MSFAAHLRRFAVLTTALGLALPSLVLANAVPAVAAPPPPRPAQHESRHVTLVTGDRVTVLDGTASIEPGPGRRTIDFETYTARGRVHVVPSDVRDELASGRLDRRLFDVTGLIDAKYDDESTGTIPLIVTYKTRTKQRTALPAAQITRELPVINGAALKVGKDRAGDFLRGLGTARSAAGIDKIWLDSKRRPTLDRSVPQIGAPTAWKSGYTGKGVKVVVLDTGVDKSHPDLATRVAGSKNFTPESAADVIGHGTHVASTIAGTGAASDGKYQGVAPGAELYDAKVCALDGCPDSTILAGMDWAVNEVGADIVNVSLGGPDQPGIDPIEAAVNRLTAERGTLFVIAAGNDGFWSGDKMVNSPGSADAALTVGGVNKDDSLADFSSRGPRAGDSAVKPDVTAPGGEIVAARSKDAEAEEPVGDKYQTLSGTSMAAPHTAGAAALLAQQHPTWQATELKSALIGSAKPNPANTVGEQGAGRIDAGTAVGQHVVVEEGNLSFGVAQWPHADDKPVVKTLTYRNYGDKAVTLDLAASMKTPKGDPAPAGAFTLSANTVTVPAGDTATVQVTSNTKHDGPDVFYSGRITASAPGLAVTTAAGVDKESERYTLNITAIGPDGTAIAPSGTLVAWNAYDFLYFGNGDKSVTLRLPKDTWSLYSTLAVPQADKRAIYHLTQPEIALTGEVSVVLDTRLAKPVRVTVPETGAKVMEAYLGLRLEKPNGNPDGLQFKFYDFDNRYSAQIGPPLAPERKLKAFVGSVWAKPNASGGFDNSPYLYGQANGFHGQYPTGFVRDVQPKELAVVHQQVSANSERKLERTIIGGLSDITAFGSLELHYDRPTPMKLLADTGAARWSTVYAELGAEGETISFVRRLGARYQAGRTYRERYLAPVHTVTANAAERTPNDLTISLRTLLDGEGNDGRADATDTAWSKLLLDGEVIAEADGFGYAYAENLPAGKAKYTLQASMTRPSYSPVSTRTDLTWTFASAAVSKATALPFISIRYRPDLGDDDLAERKPVTVLPIHLGSQVDPIDGVRPALPGVDRVSVKVSGDGGKSWRTAVVSKTGTGKYQAVYPTPKNTNSISLQAHVVDVDGNTTDLTTIDAYKLR